MQESILYKGFFHHPADQKQMHAKVISLAEKGKRRSCYTTSALENKVKLQACWDYESNRSKPG